MNRSGAIGTKAETATKRVFVRAGLRGKRIRPEGAKDVGDIDIGLDEIVVEVKGGKAAETASDELVRAWMVETDVEVENAGAVAGVLVMKRKGIGYPNADRWWAVCHLSTLLWLESGWPSSVSTASPDPLVRMLLCDWIDLLKRSLAGR